jgi:very-short-patch-repair endonuclease
MPKKITTEEFIKRATSIHGDKYDYSKVCYINSKTKINIICARHGKFNQTPSDHVYRKAGCPKCGTASTNSIRRMTTDEFISRANHIHSGKYNYPKTIYLNSRTDVNLICPTHGIFTQNPMHHLNGAGCPKCSKNCNYTTNEFISEAIKIHGNVYDYSNAVYTTAHNPIKIICKKHGIFEQHPYRHLQRQGCPKCNRSKGEVRIERYLIDNDMHYHSEYKFNECRNIHKLPFDFYIPDYNLLIEYDGEQHFKPIKQFGGVTTFNRTVENDDIKTEFAELNNINLLRIPFHKFNNIYDLLNDNIRPITPMNPKITQNITTDDL